MTASGCMRLALLAAPLVLAGCGALQGNLDLLSRGPSPEFDPAALGDFTLRQQQVLQYISQNAGLPPNTTPRTQDEWRSFVIAGFDFADSQCQNYISALRRLDIARRTTVKQLGQVGGTTASILGIVGAASSAIAITAAAFGLAQSTVDNVTGGLLYELPPSAINDLVIRTRKAYQAELKPANWQDRPSSFRTIRGYVQLCLPAVIEANATSAIRVAQPQATPLNNSASSIGAPPAIEMSTAPTAREPVLPTPPPAPAELAGDRVGMAEDKLTRTAAVTIQAALCLPPDRHTGNLDAMTRAAISRYRETFGSRATGGLTAREIVVLMQAGACDRNNYRNAFERFAYRSADAVRKLQADLATALAADGVSVPATGRFDDDTRKAIARLQEHRQLPVTGELTLDLVNTLAR